MHAVCNLLCFILVSNWSILSISFKDYFNGTGTIIWWMAEYSGMIYILCKIEIWHDHISLILQKHSNENKIDS